MDWLNEINAFLKNLNLGLTAVPPGRALSGAFPLPQVDRNVFQVGDVTTPEGLQDFLKRAALGRMGGQTLGYMLRRLAGQFLARPGAMNTIMPPVPPDMIRQIFSQWSPQG
jgi:hypothetical protein